MRAIIPALLALTLASAGPSNASFTEDERALLSQVSVAGMMSTIEQLCSDDFNGRRAGSPEHYRTVDYLASAFAECGLSTLDAPGLDGYRQPLTMRYALVRSKDEIKAILSYKAPGKHGTAERTRSFSYRGFNGRGGLDLRSEVVFVGYGIHDPESGYDDYAGLDVTGKIVLWLAGQPKGVKLAGGVTGAHKMAAAYQLGAAACLVCNPSGAKDDWGTNVGLSGSIADFPCISVDEKIASELLSASGLDLARAASQGSSPPAGIRGAKVRLQVTPVYDPGRRTYNILGALPGADPEVADELVLIGAHYDHLGSTGRGQVFQGADDNASGTSVVLEVARAIRGAGLSPRRTIVFAAWTGEEAGLVGSNYFAANPPFPLENVVSCIQLDMVGAGAPGTFLTTGASAYPDHYRHLATSAADLGLTLKADMVLGASDHLAFVRRKVPTSLIYSAGEHANVHTIRDTPAAINLRVLESSARLAALAVWRAADE